MIKVTHTRTFEHTCDRCGQWYQRMANEAEAITLPPAWHMLTRANNTVDWEFHLCEGCSKAFSDWIHHP